MGTDREETSEQAEGSGFSAAAPSSFSLGLTHTVSFPPPSFSHILIGQTLLFISVVYFALNFKITVVKSNRNLRN